MAGTQVQRRRGTTAEHATFVGAVGELTVDLNKKTVVVHDGATPGGNPLPTQFSPSFKGDTAVERDLAVGRDVGVAGGLAVGGGAAVGGALTVAGSPVVTEDSFPVSTVVGKDSPTGAALLPGGSVAERPTTPVSGMLRFNEDAEELERYVGGEWLGHNRVNKAFQEAPVVSLASAATVNIGAASANTIQITGTNPILAFDSADSGNIRRVVFSDALTLTHNASSLILPTGASIVTAAGDSAEFVSLGGGNWRCLSYALASGRALVGVEDKQLCSAWVNFNGTGTVAINDSYNVSSITDNGTGDYTLNFSTAMDNTSYSIAGSAAGSGTSGPLFVGRYPYARDIKSTTQVALFCFNFSGSPVDSVDVSVQIFGGRA